MSREPRQTDIFDREPRKQGRPEALLERKVLREFGATPFTLFCRNEVGVSFRASAYPAIEALPISDRAKELVLETLKRHRIAHGLGKGSPDLVGCAYGRFLGWELKSERGRLSSDQTQWHAAARRRGALVDVIRSLDDAADSLARAKLVGLPDLVVMAKDGSMPRRIVP